MLAPKSRVNLKVVFLAAALAIAMLAEPILAGKGGGKGGGSGGRAGGGGGQVSQRSEPARSTTRVSPPSSINTSSPKVSSPAPRVESSPRMSSSSAPSFSSPSISSRGIDRQPSRVTTSPAPMATSSAPQPGRVVSSPQPKSSGGGRQVTVERRVVFDRSPVSEKSVVGGKSSGGAVSGGSSAGIKIGGQGAASVPSGSSVSSGKSLAGGGGIEAKRNVSVPQVSSGARETKRIDPEKTNRIGGRIGDKTPAAATIEKQPSVSSSNFLGRDRDSRIDSSGSEKKSASPKVDKQVSVDASSKSNIDKSERAGGPHGDKKASIVSDAKEPVISSDKTSRIGGLIGKEMDDGNSRDKDRSTAPSQSVISSKMEPANVPNRAEKPAVLNKGSKGPGGRSDRIDSRQSLQTEKSSDDRKPAIADIKERDDGRQHKDDASEKLHRSGDKALVKPGVLGKDAAKRTDGIGKDVRFGRDVDAKGIDLRVNKHDAAKGNPIIKNRIRTEIGNKIANRVVNKSEGCKVRIRRSEWVGPHHVIYEDCPHLIDHGYRYDHAYIDYHGRICHRVIWPGYHYLVGYNWGPCRTFRYVYPYYHRKYIFVSIGGYWPVEYNCVRYYWYGYHPYVWSGYYPMPYEVQGDTYNYYTYNYYYDNEPVGTTTTTEPIETTNYIKPVDHTTFADVREKLAKQQAEQPAPETLADTFFEDGVKAFEVNDFNTAVVKFSNAMELAPGDMILPFACSQALLANEQYTEAAVVLRSALVKVTPDKEGVFYPRGLYSSDDILFEQIAQLKEKAGLYSFDADLQLLLGYQLLGVGEIDEAVEPISRAGQDLENASAAGVLLKLLEKMKANGASQATKQ